GLHANRYVDVEAVRRVVADSANIAAGRLAAERAITLVRDSLKLVPFGQMPATSRVVSITVAPRAELSAGATFNAELQRVFTQLRTQLLTPEIVFDATAGAASGGTGAYVASPTPRLLPASIDNALRAA